MRTVLSLFSIRCITLPNHLVAQTEIYTNPLHFDISYHPLHEENKQICTNMRFDLGKGSKKNSKKNLTNVSFAFTHTYTLVKPNIFGVFSQACLENFEK